MYVKEPSQIFQFKNNKINKLEVELDPQIHTI